jgi:hypothetical protein
MAQRKVDNKWKFSSLLWKVEIFLLLAPVVISFFFAFPYGPDVAYSLPDFLIMWFFISFAFVVNAMATAGILENSGVIEATAGTGTGPAGTLFYIAFAAFLDFILLREAGLLG